MAAGDFLIRRNDVETDTLPNTGSNLDPAWDSEVYDEGSAASYSAGTFTLTNTAPYLIIYSEEFNTPDTTNNERIEGNGRIRMDGVDLVIGAGEGYIRKSSGHQTMVVSGMGIYNATSGDTFVTRFYRGDDSTSGTVSRVPGVGGVQIIELDVADDFARYSFTGVQSINSTESTLVMGATEQEDTGFSRSGNIVTISTAGRYVMVFTGYTQETATARLGATVFLERGTTEVTGVRGYSHMRGADGNQDGAISFAAIVDVGTNDTFQLRCDADSGTMNMLDFEWQWWKLPSNETAIMEATTGDMNASGAFAWDTLPHIDSAAFTATAGNANIDVDQGTHALVFWNQGKKVIDSLQRAYPIGKVAIDGTELNYSASGQYHRNSGSIGTFMAHGGAVIATSVGANSEITLMNSSGGAAGTVDVESGHFSVLKLEGLYKNYSYTFPVVVASVDGDNAVTNNQTNVVILGAQFESTQNTGKVEIGPNFDYSGTKVLQSIDSWADGTIQFDVSPGALSDTNSYLFVTNDAGLRGVIALRVGLPPETYAEAVLGMSQPPSHYWKFQNDYEDEVGTATADAANNAGPPTFPTDTLLVKGDTHAMLIDAETTYTSPADQPDMNTSAISRRYIGGWFQLDGVSQTLSVIYEEGAQVNNMALLNGFGNNAVFQIANASDDYVQLYMDISLTPNRPYFFLAKMHASGFDGGVCAAYLDGVLQSRTNGNPWETAQLDSHSGNITWGHEGTESLKVGDDRGVDATTIAFVSPVSCHYANWFNWTDVTLNVATDIRQTLFEKGAPTQEAILGDTESNMQAVLSLAPPGYVFPDWPCAMEIGTCTEGDFTLTVNNLNFEDRVSIQVRYLGIDTLTLVAENGTVFDPTKLATPYGGTILVETPATFEIQGIITGAEVRIYDDEDPDPSNFDTELGGIESSPGTTFQYSHNGSSNDIIVQMIADGYEEVRLSFTLDSTDQILVLLPEVETNL